MIISCREARPITTRWLVYQRISRTLRRPALQLRAGTTEVASEKPSGSRTNAATGSGRNGFQIRMRTVARTHLVHHLLAARTHAGVARCTHKGNLTPVTSHPSRRSFGTARRIRLFIRKPLGLNPSTGRSCPDPGRLSTFGVSGLYPCRRLTYRGACPSILAPEAMQVKHNRKRIYGPLRIGAVQRGGRRGSPTMGSRHFVLVAA
jgi:hypothetical protein